MNTPRPDLVKKYALWIPALQRNPNAKLIEIYNLVFEELSSLDEAFRGFANSPSCIFTKEERRFGRKMVCIKRLNIDTGLVELVDKQILASNLAEAKRRAFPYQLESSSPTTLSVDVTCSCCPLKVKSEEHKGVLYDSSYLYSS